MLSKKPEDRYPSGRELLADLRALAVDPNSYWAAAADEWSTAELIALVDDRNKATNELSELMQTSTMLAIKPKRKKTMVLLSLLALGAGILAATMLRPKPLLSEAESFGVLPRTTVLSQLYHAKLADTEAAWKSVKGFHPKALDYHHYLADVGLVQYYLFRSFSEVNLNKVKATLQSVGRSA